MVRSVLHGTHHGPHVSLSHFNRVVGIEAGHVVVHLWAVLVSESDEFENLEGGGEIFFFFSDLLVGIYLISFLMFSLFFLIRFGAFFSI